MIFKSNSLDETFKISSDIAQGYRDHGGVIALSGELGAGKTTFTKGFAKALDIKDKIISPTFVLIRQHPIPNSKRTLYHIDLYRLEGEIDLVSTGVKEIIENPDNIVMIEWAEKAKDQLPHDTLWINFTRDLETRIIEVSTLY